MTFVIGTNIIIAIIVNLLLREWIFYMEWVCA